MENMFLEDMEEPITPRTPPYYSDQQCPQCRSHSVESLNYATRAGCAIGAIAGIGASIAGSFRGARIGASIGMLSGPLGASLGGFAGAVLDALTSGAAGCATGIALGRIVDGTMLKNHKCHQCGYLFSDAS